MFCVYLNQTCNKKTYLLQMLQSFYNVIEDQKYYPDPIYIVHLINSFESVPASQVRQEMFVLGLRSYLS